jgi:MFS transporter, OFA family, oxalate/formate antiporter
MRRWTVLAACVATQAVLGGVYAWSVFVPPLTAQYGLGKGQCGLIMGLCIATMTLVMLVSGQVLQARGPRVTGLVSAALYFAGYLAASMSGGSYPVLLVALGPVLGAAIGFGYVSPLALGVQWFPNHKGLITGVAVAGFGGGAIVLSQVVEALLLQGVGVLVIFRGMGIVLGGALLVAALLLAEPARPGAPAHRSRAGRVMGVVLTQPFSVPVAGMFVTAFAGMAVIGNLAPFALRAGLSGREAATAVSVFALGNTLGRVGWGRVSDRLGEPVLPVSQIYLAVALGVFALPLPGLAFILASGLVGFGFGGSFVVYAAHIVREFGGTLFPKLYPVCFLGYGLAGLAAPAAGGWVADAAGGHALPVGITAAATLLTAAFTTRGLRVARRRHDAHRAAPGPTRHE